MQGVRAALDVKNVASLDELILFLVGEASKFHRADVRPAHPHRGADDGVHLPASRGMRAAREEPTRRQSDDAVLHEDAVGLSVVRRDGNHTARMRLELLDERVVLCRGELVAEGRAAVVLHPLRRGETRGDAPGQEHAPVLLRVHAAGARVGPKSDER